MSNRVGMIRSLDCQAVESRLEAFLLEELEPREQTRLDRHLRDCAACRARVGAEQELLAWIPRSLEPQAPPPDVLVGLLNRVRDDRGRRRRWSVTYGFAVAAASIALTLLIFRPVTANSLARMLESPDVAVINLFASLDSPLAARYEYRTETHVRFDRSVGRILFNVSSGEWQLAVHGLPRPPRGGRYILTGLVDDQIVDLGTIARWEDGVATLRGQSPIDLTQTQRLSVVLDARGTRLRLLDAVDGAW